LSRNFSLWNASDLDAGDILADSRNLKIRIPGRAAESTPVKRKHDDTNGASDTEPAAEAAGSTKAVKPVHASKKPKKSKGQKRKDHSDKENGQSNNEDRLPVVHQKKRGRPRKVPEEANGSREFLVPVFVETARDPILTRGRTHKGDKFVKQLPLTDGPFHLSSKMTWPDFVENVVKVAKITKENLGPVIADMKWSFQKKTGLPLTDVTGFQTMLQQV